MGDVLRLQNEVEQQGKELIQCSVLIKELRQENADLKGQVKYWEAADDLIRIDRADWIDKVEKLDKKIASITEQWDSFYKSWSKQ